VDLRLRGRHGELDNTVPAGRRTFYVEAEVARLSTLLLEQRIPVFDESDERAYPAIPVIEDGGPLSRR
jgi:hypothetical protein